MEALEFAREYKRMCDTYESCRSCPIGISNIDNRCSISNLEETLPLVEKWSKEHPRVTNLDHYAEELERIGYKVDKGYMRNSCPVPKSPHFSVNYECFQGDCVSCRKWWDEEYKEEKK